MGIKIAGENIADLKLGTTNIEKVYQGANLIWQRSSGGGGPTPGDVVFQNALGFSISGNSVARINSGPYNGSVESQQQIAEDGDGGFLFMFTTSPAPNQTPKIVLDDGTNQYAIVPYPTYVEFQKNNAYQGDAGGVSYNTQIYGFDRAGGAISVVRDGTAIHTFSGTSLAAARLKVFVSNDGPGDIGKGINTATWY